MKSASILLKVAAVTTACFVAVSGSATAVAQESGSLSTESLDSESVQGTGSESGSLGGLLGGSSDSGSAALGSIGRQETPAKVESVVVAKADEAGAITVENDGARATAPRRAFAPGAEVALVKVTNTGLAQYQGLGQVSEGYTLVGLGGASPRSPVTFTMDLSGMDPAVLDSGQYLPVGFRTSMDKGDFGLAEVKIDKNRKTATYAVDYRAGFAAASEADGFRPALSWDDVQKGAKNAGKWVADTSAPTLRGVGDALRSSGEAVAGATSVVFFNLNELNNKVQRAVSVALGWSSPRPRCYGRPVTIGGVEYRVTDPKLDVGFDTGLDNRVIAWPCLTEDRGRLKVDVVANQPLGWRLSSRQSVTVGHETDATLDGITQMLVQTMMGQAVLLRGANKSLTYNVANLPAEVAFRADPGPSLMDALLITFDAFLGLVFPPAKLVKMDEVFSALSKVSGTQTCIKNYISAIGNGTRADNVTRAVAQTSSCIVTLLKVTEDIGGVVLDLVLALPKLVGVLTGQIIGAAQSFRSLFESETQAIMKIESRNTSPSPAPTTPRPRPTPQPEQPVGNPEIPAEYRNTCDGRIVDRRSANDRHHGAINMLLVLLNRQFAPGRTAMCTIFVDRSGEGLTMDSWDTPNLEMRFPRQFTDGAGGYHVSYYDRSVSAVTFSKVYVSTPTGFVNNMVKPGQCWIRPAAPGVEHCFRT